MKIAKVFANGRSRAVRIPRDWLGGADEVELRREGQTIVIAPVRPSMEEVARQFRSHPFTLDRHQQSKTPPKLLDL